MLNHSANVSMVFLGLLVIISFSAIVIQRDAIFIAKLKSNEIHAQKRSELKLASSMKAMLEQYANQPDRVFCETLCSINEDKNIALPLINYDLIFRNRIECSQSPIQNQNTSNLGFTLSADSVRASQVCATLPSTVTDAYAIDSNLESTEGTKTSDAVLIAATGYIDIQSQVVISGQAYIIAGGDIHIKDIRSDFPASLVILSATGGIEIDSISGVSQVAAFSRKTINIPTTYTSNPSSLQNFRLENILIGRP